MYVVLAGGVGAAKFIRGLQAVVAPKEIVAVVNTGDDERFHGLWVSPDIDTVTYSLSGLSNDELGWGVKDESFRAMESLGSLGGDNWFSLGDRDLGTHLYRTDRLEEGATLSQVTSQISFARGVRVRVTPMSDDRVQTKISIQVDGSPRTVGFQEYFVKLRHQPEILAVDYVGANAAKPAPGVVEAIESATCVIIAPSNPVLSIGPILAIPEIDGALRSARSKTVSISPIVGGRAIKGPAQSNLKSLHGSASALTVAGLYREYCSGFVLDQTDSELSESISEIISSVLVTDTMMVDRQAEERLAKGVIEYALSRTT